MKKAFVLFLAFVFLCLFFAGTKRPVHIFMAGDSTMALKPFYKNVWDTVIGDSVSEVFPERGWGQLLPEFFNEKVVVEDYAQNGRSSRTFIEQGWWDKIIDNVKKVITLLFNLVITMQLKINKIVTLHQHSMWKISLAL